jgi:NAD(P)-dependent dehydrogenase (short-subunit alcohol dehydrogenase family)
VYNPFTLKDKRILITGASSGIGRAIAIECSKMGATVILTARNEERLNETLSQMDNLEWHHGYRPRFGLLYVNYTNLERTPKLSAEWMNAVIKSGRVV